MKAFKSYREGEWMGLSDESRESVVWEREVKDSGGSCPNKN